MKQRVVADSLTPTPGWSYLSKLDASVVECLKSHHGCGTAWQVFFFFNSCLVVYVVDCIFLSWSDFFIVCVRIAGEDNHDLVVSSGKFFSIFWKVFIHFYSIFQIQMYVAVFFVGTSMLLAINDLVIYGSKVHVYFFRIFVLYYPWYWWHLCSSILL